MPRDDKATIAAVGHLPINPMGECFSSAAAQVLLTENLPEDVRLCHGIGRAQAPGEEGEPMGHAWVEYSTTKGLRVAIDTTWGVYVPAEDYRRDAQIEYCVEYSPAEVRALSKPPRPVGPWDAHILEFYSRGEKPPT